MEAMDNAQNRLDFPPVAQTIFASSWWIQNKQKKCVVCLFFVLFFPFLLKNKKCE